MLLVVLMVASIVNVPNNFRFLTGFLLFVTESMLTSRFQMEVLLKALKNNKATDLDDMFSEQIKNFCPATLRWVLPMMSSILKSHKFPKL